MKAMKTSAVETSAQIDRLIAQQQRTANSMEQNLVRSKAALDASIKASHNDQRAWLGAWKFSMLSDAEVGKEFLSQYEVENSGKTAALNVVANSATFFDTGDNRSIDWSLIKKTHRGILWPSMSIGPVIAGKGSGQFTTPGVVGGYREHITKAYVIIRITYDDVFGCSHWTEVCTVHSYGESAIPFELCNRNGMDDVNTCAKVKPR